MRCFVAAVFLLAVWAGRGEAVKCDDIMSCVQGMDMSTDQDISVLCRKVRGAMECFKEAMQDCRNSRSIPEDTIQTLESQLQVYVDMLKDECQPYDSGYGSSSHSSSSSSFSSSDSGNVIATFIVSVITSILAFI